MTAPEQAHVDVGVTDVRVKTNLKQLQLHTKRQRVSGVALLQSAPQLRATTQFLIFVASHSQNRLN